jgi:hypothetical protein
MDETNAQDSGMAAMEGLLLRALRLARNAGNGPVERGVLALLISLERRYALAARDGNGAMGDGAGDSASPENGHGQEQS